MPRKNDAYTPKLHPYSINLCVEKQTANIILCIDEMVVSTGDRNMLFLLLQENYFMRSNLSNL
jgi:hypothetical protein